MQHTAPHKLKERSMRVYQTATDLEEYDSVKFECREEARAAILAYARVASNPHTFLLSIVGELCGNSDEQDMLMNLQQAVLHSLDGEHEDAANCAENMVDAAARIRDEFDAAIA